MNKWKYPALAVALLLLVSGWVQAARYIGIADAEREVANRQTVILMAQGDAIVRAQARVTALTDSLAALREADAARITALEAVRADLGARSDSLVAAARLAADTTGSVPIATFEASVAMLEHQIAAVDTARSIERIGRLRAEAVACAGCRVLLTELTAQVVQLEARDETRLREIAALRSAIAPSFTLKIKQGWYLVVAGMAIGYVAAGR